MFFKCFATFLQMCYFTRTTVLLLAFLFRHKTGLNWYNSTNIKSYKYYHQNLNLQLRGETMGNLKITRTDSQTEMIK